MKVAMKGLRDYRIRRYMFALVGCLPGAGRGLILFVIAMRRKLAPGRCGETGFLWEENSSTREARGTKTARKAQQC